MKVEAGWLGCLILFPGQILKSSMLLAETIRGCYPPRALYWATPQYSYTIEGGHSIRSGLFNGQVQRI